MVKKLRTTIEIAEVARKAYLQMIKRYGIRSAVSAGILLLSKLTPKEREKIIDSINGDNSSSKCPECGNVHITKKV